MPDTRDTVPVRNAHGTRVPPHGLMKSTGTHDPDGSILVTRPDADSLSGLIVNGPFSIEPGEYGSGTLSTREVIAYDTVGGVPTAGGDYGSEAASWLAVAGKTGFVALSGGAGFVNAVRAAVPSAATAQPLCEVTAYNAGTLYHTAKLKTWIAGAIADDPSSPLATTCRSTTGDPLPIGTICYLDPIHNIPGDFWVSPDPEYADTGKPGLVSYGPGVQHYSGPKEFDSFVQVDDALIAESSAALNAGGPTKIGHTETSSIQMADVVAGVVTGGASFVDNTGSGAKVYWNVILPAYDPGNSYLNLGGGLQAGMWITSGTGFAIYAGSPPVFYSGQTTTVLQVLVLDSGVISSVGAQWIGGILVTYGGPPAALPLASIGFTPGNPANWAGAAPTDIQAALDRLAAALALAGFPP